MQISIFSSDYRSRAQELSNYVSNIIELYHKWEKRGGHCDPPRGSFGPPPLFSQFWVNRTSVGIGLKQYVQRQKSYFNKCDRNFFVSFMSLQSHPLWITMYVNCICVLLFMSSLQSHLLWITMYVNCICVLLFMSSLQSHSLCITIYANFNCVLLFTQC